MTDPAYFPGAVSAEWPLDKYTRRCSDALVHPATLDRWTRGLLPRPYPGVTLAVHAIRAGSGLPVPPLRDSAPADIANASIISRRKCEGQRPICMSCLNSGSNCTWILQSIHPHSASNRRLQMGGNAIRVEAADEIRGPLLRNIEPGLASADWVAGTIIQVDHFERQESSSVILVSDEQVNNGASAAIFQGISEKGLVALKVFGGIMSREQRLTLLRELRNVRGLKHDHILSYIGSAVHGLRTILVSPFMQNGDMLCYLRAHQDVKREQLILQVASSVEYLHIEKQLIHGDLKCENVLISDDGNALLTDFGLSTFIDNSQTITTLTGMRLCNTIPFAAPELLMGEISQLTSDGRVRPRSKSTETDVYAFGMLIVQAFIQNSPWPGMLVPQIIARVVSGLTHPRPGRDIDSAGMSDVWWDACCTCWALKPSERPSIAQVASALQA